MIYRIPITKDTTISTWSEIPTLRDLGNAGASQIVDVWAQYRQDKNLRFLTRFLADVSLTGLQNAIADGQVPDPRLDASVSCNLRFFNINHGDSAAYEFSLQMFPVTRQWLEGRGTRIDSFTNTGIANWLSASNTAAWTNSGGDFAVDSNSASQFFESGAEDLNVGIRGMLNNWLNNPATSYGFLVKMEDIAENLTGSLSTSTQYYRKAFHGRLTNFPNFAPYIQLEWTSLITDDREIGKFGSPMSLYLFNSPNASYGDINSITAGFPGSITISASIQGVSGALSAYDGDVTHNFPASSYTSLVGAGLNALTASRVKSGIYQTTFTLPASAVLFNTFVDVWSVSSALSAAVSALTQVFTPQLPLTADSNFVSFDLNMAIPNWKNFYNKDSTISKKVYFFEKTGNVLPLAQSEKNSISSIASSTLSTYVTTNGWWRVVVPALGVVDVDWQRLEYDGNSNFFTIDISNFARQVRYQLEFKTVIRGETIIFDDKNGAQPFYFEVLE